MQLNSVLKLRKCHTIKTGSTAMTQRPRDRVPSGSMLATPDPRRLERANPPTNFWWSLFFFFFLTAMASSTCTGFPLDSQQGILCWGFKGVQEEIPPEEASTLKIGSVAFPAGQCTSPQLHLSHRLFDQDGHQDSFSTPLYSSDLAPCDFFLFPKLTGCRNERIEEMKEAVTKVIDMHTQENFLWAFPNLLELYNKCIADGGYYFERD